MCGLKMRTRPSSSKLTINSQTIVMFVVLLTVVITNISQMSMFIDTGASSKVSIVAWTVCLLFVILCCKKILRKKVLPLILLSLAFLVLVGINYLFTGLNYWESAHVYSLFISLFIYLIGCMATDSFSGEGWNKLIIAYVIGSCIVALEVFVNYFMHGFDISSRIYAYDSKNSLSQILLTAIILIIFGFDKYYKAKYRTANIIIVVGLFALICVMKSRATLLGFIVLFIALMMDRTIKRRYKTLLTIGVLVAVVMIFRIPSLNDLVINNIMFAGRTAGNLNDLSSGRVIIVQNGINQIKDNLFSGIGNKYLDCYPVATILQFGLLPGIILWMIALLPLYTSIKLIKRNMLIYNYPLIVSLVVLSGTYALNGIFEALTPLGPGVKCYLLWFVLGIVCNAGDNQTSFIQDEKGQTYEY